MYLRKCSATISLFARIRLFARVSLYCILVPAGIRVSGSMKPLTISLDANTMLDV